MRVGATPVFVDIDEGTFNIDPDLIEHAITERTRAILPVHLFGLPADMPRILDIANRHGLLVMEDAAQAFGARVSALGGRRIGSLGHAAAFSFYPTKNLGAYGDGGLLATNDAEVAATARSLRDHGARPSAKYVHDRLGYNSRLDALQAAVLRVKLPHVDAWNRARLTAARGYGDALSSLDRLRVPRVTEDHVFHQYTVRVLGCEAAHVQGALKQGGIAAVRYYPVPLSEQLGQASSEAFEVSRSAARSALSLPLSVNTPSATPTRVLEVLASLD